MNQPTTLSILEILTLNKEFTRRDNSRLGENLPVYSRISPSQVSLSRPGENISLKRGSSSIAQYFTLLGCYKRRHTYIVWDVLEEDSTTSTSEDEESAQLCLMVNTQETSTSTNNDKQSEVNSYETSSCSSSENSPTYDELYNAFVELHEVLKKLARINVDRKILIILHENNVSNMQKELDDLKLENETLDLIYSCASCNCSTKIIEAAICEKWQILDAENSVLKNKMTKFTYSRQNLDT
ncbi:hypothetical protein Lal_00015147 [Lupinus albus]|nr:hypothetical protein Lal_00015147 [Lupinus albus]